MTEIGRLEYGVDVDLAGLRAALAEAVAEARAATGSIDGLEANAEIGATIKDLEAKVAAADALLSEIDGQTAEAHLKLDNKQFQSGVRRGVVDLRQLTKTVADHSHELAQARSEYARLYTARKRADDVDFGRTTARERLEISRLDAALASTGSRIRELGGHTRNLRVDLEKDRNLFARWATSLAGARVHLGFFSTSLKGLGAVIVGLGPIILGVIGTASALVGVLGTALTGAMAVGTAAVSGFGIALLGLLPSLKQLGTELKADATITGPLQKMRDTLTKDIRPDFFSVAHDGVQTLQADFPTFQAGATSAFHAAAQGAHEWLAGLRSPEARNILKDLLASVTASLPPLMDGLGHIATALGRVGQSASHFLPGLNQGFEQWAQNLERSIGKGAQLDTRVGRLVTHMRDVGHLAQQSGRLLINFFGAGANTGDSLVRSLTSVFAEWNAWMRSVEGQKSLQDFFQRSADLARQLFPAIARIATSIANLSAAAEPLTEGVAAGLNAIAKVAASIPAPVLQAAGAFLIFRKALTFLAGEQALAGLTGLFKGLIPLAGAFRAAIGVEGLAGGARLAGVALGGLLSPLAAAGAVFGGVVIGAHLLSDSMDGLSDSTKQAIERYHEQMRLVEQLPGRVNTYRDSLKSLKEAQDAYDKTVKSSGKNSEQASAALRTLNGATKAYNASLGPLKSSIKASFDDGVGEASRSLTNFNNYLQSSDTYLLDFARSQAMAAGRGNQFETALTRTGTSVRGVIQALKAAGLSARQLGLTDLPVLNNQLRQFNATQQSAAARLVNTGRAMKGLAPISAASAAAVGKFIQTFGQVKGAKRAVITTNAPQQAAQIAKVSNSLQKLGAKKAVIRILAQGGNANEILDKLEKKRDSITRKKGVAKVDAQTSGESKLDTLKGKLDELSKSHDAVVHLLGAPAAEAAAHRATAAVLAFPTGSRTMNLITNYQTHGSPPGHYAGGIIPGFADGGAIDQMMERAYLSADRRMTRDADRGMRVNRPTYITGEERGATEFIITDNPAYRRSNLSFLAMAAQALGQVMIPGYARGGARKSKKKKSGGGGYPSLDDATGPDSRYAELEDLVQFDSDMADLVRRKYDTNQGASLTDVIGAVKTEITDYGTLAGAIASMLSNPALIRPIDRKDIPKPLKGKAADKHPKKAAAAQARHDAAVAHNDAIRGGKEDLQDELRSIRQIILPGLELDILEAQNAASTNTILGQETANLQRYNLFREFASNIIGGVSIPSLGAAGLASASSSPALSDLSARATTSPNIGISAPVDNGPHRQRGDVTLVNHYAAPPPDPHTYTKGVLFEIGASGV